MPVDAPLVGEDQYESELHAFVAANDLGERVHFLGVQHDIPACMCAVDAVVHMSITAEAA